MHALSKFSPRNEYMNKKLHTNKLFCLPEAYAFQSNIVQSKCIKDNHISYKFNILMAIIHRQKLIY